MRDNRNSMAWIVWGVGVFAYSVTVMQRTALGVAGLEAADHFRTTPGVVSTLVVVQLFSYAFAQVPIGVLLDRYGSRIMLTAGSLVVAASQVLLGVADEDPEGSADVRLDVDRGHREGLGADGEVADPVDPERRDSLVLPEAREQVQRRAVPDQA